ncbi:hypothetical protein Nepgr_031989, partial [Nepenthes gracilis]
ACLLPLPSSLSLYSTFHLSINSHPLLGCLLHFSYFFLLCSLFHPLLVLAFCCYT